ncbi:hypothetical protein QRD89_18870 [Halobacillus sp. ACCC02827]|uniref:hypothetical protein n=1 Tax=Halobacillus sp. ACCC02827 TaxID=3052090 RepID=UPI002570D382|nr:hypothetical protein [Halobacillus sp. ACCC02827]WJE15759.1 hypothetical protein QRD89_18870 [Halobacillus sp. ACCC02827]
MNQALLTVLVEAKKLDKWVAAKYLVEYGICEFDLMQLEDDGLLLVSDRRGEGKVLKLTLKGYHHFK